MQDDYSICQGIVSHYCKVQFCNVTSYFHCHCQKTSLLPMIWLSTRTGAARIDEKISLWYGLVLRRSLETFVRNVLFETKLAAVTVLIEWKSTICLFFHRQIGGGGIILDALMRTSCIFSCEREKSWWVTKGLFSTPRVGFCCGDGVIFQSAACY